MDLLDSEVELPNGVTVPNRLVKAAMEEGIGTGGGLPGKAHQRLYARWAEGGWGMIITGNAQVDERHLATPHDRTISDSPASLAAYTSLLTSILSRVPSSAEPPLCLVQISHAGLQSSSTINFSRAPWTPAMGPCSARPDTGSSALGWLLGRIIWPTESREIIDFDEWLGIVDQFVKSAKMAEEAGWDGVQIHSAHGYLLAEYLSPLASRPTNPMARPLPGVDASIPNRLHLLYLILKRLQAETNTKFIKAVKINSSDFVQGGVDEAQASEMIKEIVSWKLVDILEISGGNYSNPAFMDLSPSPRQALFSKFTTSLLPSLLSPPEGPAIMLTGGMHSRTLIAESLRDRACDLVGIGRPACLRPTLPRDIILNKEISDDEATVAGSTIPGAATWKWILGGGTTARPAHAAAPAPATYTDAEDERAPLLPEQSRSKSNGIPLVGAGVSTFWHEWQLCRMGRGLEPDPQMSWGYGLAIEALWWGVLKGGPVGWWQACTKR